MELQFNPVIWAINYNLRSGRTQAETWFSLTNVEECAQQLFYFLFIFPLFELLNNIFLFKKVSSSLQEVRNEKPRWMVIANLCLPVLNLNTLWPSGSTCLLALVIVGPLRASSDGPAH